MLKTDPRNRRLLDHVGEYTTLLGRDAAFEGMLRGKGNYLVQAQVTGDGDLDGSLMVTETARWRGDIVAINVVVHGEIEGDITARERVVLAPTARVRGNVTAAAITIAEGAVLDGAVRMARPAQVMRHGERRHAPGESG